MSLLRNTSWSAVASITNTVGRMAIVAVLARRLGPASFGLFVFVQWLIEIASLVCSAGLPSAATRFFPQTTGDGTIQMSGFGRWFLRWSVVAVVLTGLVATLCAVAFSDLADTASLAAVAFWATSSAAWALLGARAQGLFQFKRYAASSALFVAVALLGLALPRAGRDVVAAMICFGAANFAAAAYCAVALPNTGRAHSDLTLSKVDAQLVWPYAANAWLATLSASFVWARGEIAVVKGHLGESAVGFYSAGLTLSGVVNQGIGLLTGGLWPQIARQWDRGERDGVLRLSSLITNVLILAAGLSSGFVICFAPYLVVLLFGKAFHQSSDLVLLLALGPLGLASGCASLVLQAATNGRFNRNVSFLGGLALFGAAFVLVPLFGISGAAMARSATQIGIAILTLAWVGRVIGHDVGTRQNLHSFLVLVALTIGLVVVLTSEPNLHIFSRAMLFAVYSCFVCLLCAPIRDVRALRQLRSLVLLGGVSG